jgi:hypothetical protein
VPTANIWNKTELMIASLAAVKDKFELLVRVNAQNSATCCIQGGYWL